MEEIKELFKRIKQVNKELRELKRKQRFLDKLIKLTKKYNLELTREDNVNGSKLIIRGFSFR